MYEAIKERLPKGSVVALRHFHGQSQGPYSIVTDETTDTWDSELEIAMEAMQIRGNIMLGQAQEERWMKVDSMPAFPGNFLDSGAVIGLVGGTDHSTGKPLNHYCLTGFWVEDDTPEAVWDALVNRRTVACSNGKISMWTDLNGMPMGSELKAGGAVSINVRIAAAREITRVCLIRDGQMLDWTDVHADSANLSLVDRSAAPGRHWYVVTVEGVSAYEEGGVLGRKIQAASVIAHASPYFVDVK